MPSLRIPRHLRSELSSTSYGTVFSGEPESNAKRILKLINGEHPPKVIIVGDFTLQLFHDLGYKPDLGIFDRMTKRSPLGPAEGYDERVTNPAGFITEEADSSVARLLAAPSPSLLYVEGEEDLLALPAIALAPEGSFVIYGLPGVGMLLIRANKKTKEKIRALIGKFERID